MEPSANPVAARQVPQPGGVTLDHVGHWVPDIEAAAARLEQLGFAPTPYSRQFLPPAPGAPPVPAGTANRCIMLDGGYIEVLAPEPPPVGDTPNAATVRQGIARYVGVHIVAFGAADAATTAARLNEARFQPLPPVHLERPIDDAGTMATARFTVLRLAAGTMPEGRIQYCIHHTPALLWQKRWLGHRNAAAALHSVMIAVADIDEAAQRYERILGLRPTRRPDGVVVFRLDRGLLLLAGPQATHVPASAALPCVTGYGVRVHDLKQTARVLDDSGVAGDRSRAGIIAVDGGTALGATILFHE